MVIIKFKGLGKDDTILFTREIAKSGKKFDYRNSKTLNRRKIISRYPTGALSEKIALIMPSLLFCLAKTYKFCSPFLIAKSLGYTGGTWDKLLSIPNFNFPLQGIETLNILKQCNVTMAVTKGNFNPVDRILYQLRSLTNTVDSFPLIVSSIGSKQLALPLDSLLLDIRYGSGTFLKTLNEAKLFYQYLFEITSSENIKTNVYILRQIK